MRIILRNPLSAILAYSQFLVDEVSVSLSAEQLEFLDTIRASSEFMLGLVNNLIDVAQIESGKLQLDIQPTDLGALVRYNVALNRVLAAKKQIEIQLTDAPLPKMFVDVFKIEQVLNNLIGNAIKFSNPQTTIQVRMSQEDAKVLLAVQDQGQGIPAHELDKLFKPFQKTSIKGTAGEKSTGLGLSIVKKIVQGHGGKIWVESQVGKGTTFFVTLPSDLTGF